MSGNGDGDFVSYKECQSNIQHIKSMVNNIGIDVGRNRETNEKIIKILQGNGEGGLIWKVNALLLRNQWVDRLINAALSVFLTLLTLYISGVLHL